MVNAQPLWTWWLPSMDGGPADGAKDTQVVMWGPEGKVETTSWYIGQATQAAWWMVVKRRPDGEYVFTLEWYRVR